MSKEKTAVSKIADAFEAFTAVELKKWLEENLPELLRVEKEQIKDAFNNGFRDAENSDISISIDSRDISECSNASEYYNDKYGELN